MSVKEYFNKHIEIIKRTAIELDQYRIEKFINLLSLNTNKLFFTGVGKNGQVAAKAASTFCSIGISSNYICPMNAMHGDLGNINENDLIVAISKSGETKELIKFLVKAKQKKAKIILIHANTNNVGLKLADLDIDLYVEKECDELNILPSASIAVFTIFLQSVACELAHKKNLNVEDIVMNHPGGKIGTYNISKQY